MSEQWSFIRSVMCQGVSIYQDYATGKYASYEEYSARLDCAARERELEYEAAFGVADQQKHPDDADEAVFTAQEERIAELEASLDNARSQLTALRLKAASYPELRPADDDQCGGG